MPGYGSTGPGPRVCIPRGAVDGRLGNVLHLGTSGHPVGMRGKVAMPDFLAEAQGALAVMAVLYERGGRGELGTWTASITPDLRASVVARAPGFGVRRLQLLCGSRGSMPAGGSPITPGVGRRARGAHRRPGQFSPRATGQDKAGLCQPLPVIHPRRCRRPQRTEI